MGDGVKKKVNIQPDLEEVCEMRITQIVAGSLG